MIDPYSIEQLLNQVVIYLDGYVIKEGIVAKFESEENNWLINTGSGFITREYTELGQVVGFLRRNSGTVQWSEDYSRSVGKFVLKYPSAPRTISNVQVEDGLSIMNVVVLLNGTGVYMS